MSSKVLKWLILLALLLLIVSFFSFWFSGPSFRDKDVELKIEGPSQIAVGDEIVYKLKYSNDSKLKLYDLNFSFSYPQDSVVIKNGDVKTDRSERFKVDTLEPGESGEKEFHAFIVGDKGDIKEAKVDLSFRAESLRSSFEKRAALSTTIVSVPVLLTIVAPPNVIPGESVEYILDYRNESGNAIENLLIEFLFPEGFTAKEFSPEPDSVSKWHIDSLKKSGAGRIHIKGVLSGKEGETKNIQVSLKRKISNQYIDFEKASSFSVVSSPLLNLDVSVNGSKVYVANPGDALDYSLKYKNNSEFSLSGLTLSIKLDGDMYDFSSLDTKGGFFDSSKRVIIWGPSNIGDFSNLLPGSEGVINFSVKLKSGLDLQGSNTLFVKSSAKFSTSNVPDGIEGNEVSAFSNLVTNITKQPTLVQSIDSGNSGIFTVRWSISNPGNGLNNSVITAILPEGVSWNNVFNSNANLQAPKFNDTDRKLSWDMGTIPGGVGSSMPKYELEFQVSAGSLSEVVKNIELSGVDSVTGQNIIIQYN